MTLVVPFEEIFAEEKGLLAKKEDWERIELGQCATILNGFPFKSSLFSNESGFPLIRIRDLTTHQPITFYPGEYPAEYVMKRGDLLIGMDGIFRCVEWNGQDGLLNQRVCKITPNESKLDKRFLKYGINGYLDAIQKSTSSVTVGHLSSRDILHIPFPVPPLDEQRRIADKLDHIAAHVDDTRARLDTIPAILKRFRMSVLAAACSGNLTQEWRKDHPTKTATMLLAAIKAARLATASRETDRRKIIEFFDAFPEHEGDGSSIPTSWLKCFVGSVGHVCNGSTPSRKELSYWGGGIPWVSSGEVQNCFVDSTRESITQAGYDNSSVRLLPKGTVLIAMIGEGKTRGQSAILGIEACINQNMAAIIIDHELIAPQYLWYWFQSQYDSNREVGSGSGPQALNCQRVRELPLNLPPLDEQVEIVRRIEIMFRQADVIESRYRKAKTFTDKLMPSVLAKAFRGELV